MFTFDNDVFVPIMIFAIPIVAIAGGITAGIIRTLGQQRLLELAQRERIAAIERGVDPSKLPPMPIATSGHDHDLASMYMSFHDYSKRRSQNLLIGGLITLFVGIALAVFLSQVATGEDDKAVWLVGGIPASVGLALLIGSQIVKPRNGDSGSSSPPRS
jgi:hypothetical protein